jgi:hypothetical protein
MSEPDAWNDNAQNGWAALHNIREVLTQLAPPARCRTKRSSPTARSTCMRLRC